MLGKRMVFGFWVVGWVGKNKCFFDFGLGSCLGSSCFLPAVFQWFFACFGDVFCLSGSSSCTIFQDQRKLKLRCFSLGPLKLLVCLKTLWVLEASIFFTMEEEDPRNM